MSTLHEYSLPRDLESQAWFADSCASHHLTSNSIYLHAKKPYSGTCRVSVANDQSLTITYVGSFDVYSNLCLSYTLSLNDILHVLCITRNLLFVSNFSKDNHVTFEFSANK